MYSRISKVLIAALFVAAVAVSSNAMAQDVSKSSLVVKETDDGALEKLAWLVGHWEGNAFGGVCEEIWSPASGGSMTGTFKLITGGQVAFYEIMTITVDSLGPVMNLKHFNSDLTGWEEKDKVITFAYESMSDGEIQFDGLVYRAIGDDSLRITVKTKADDGSISETVIDCKRVDK